MKLRADDHEIVNFNSGLCFNSGSVFSCEVSANRFVARRADGNSVTNSTLANATPWHMELTHMYIYFGDRDDTNT